MSRSYRIGVRETLSRVLRASDHVSAQLELLEILPPEQMSELLAQELIAQGFQRQGDQVTRQTQGITISVELATGKVVASSQSQQAVSLASEKQRTIYDDTDTKREAQEELRTQAQQSLEQEAQERQAELQKQVTDRLEGELADLKQELDQAVNRATAAALKIKAAQMGQIKTITEDPASGSLTIVVEV